MGARASIMLVRGKKKSPVLCQHWGGNEFHEDVREFVDKIYEYRVGKSMTDEEAARVFNTKVLGLMTRLAEIDRIFTLIVMNFGDGGYVGRDRNDVDDSDYGCLIIDLSGDKPVYHR